MKYHVTIKDNETNKTLQEFDCNTVVGGATGDGGLCTVICVVHSNGFEMVSACSCAQKAIDKVLDLNPMAEFVYENRNKFFDEKPIE